MYICMHGATIIGRICAEHQSMHGTTKLGHIYSEHQSMHGTTKIGRICSEHQSMHGATIIGHKHIDLVVPQSLFISKYVLIGRNYSEHQLKYAIILDV